MRHWFKDQHFRSLLKNTSYLAVSKGVAAVASIVTDVTPAVPFDGDTDSRAVGAASTTTVTVAGVLAPKALEQATVMVLAPTLRPTELVEVLVEAAPLTVQVVPAGIVDPPLTV